MTYDLEDLARRVYQKRKRFLLRMSAAVGLILVGACLMLWNFDTTLTFLSGVVIFACLIFICHTVLRLSPATLFARAIEGVNVKEHEYIAQRTQGVLKGSSRVPHLPYTYANRKSTVPRHLIRGSVYLRLEDGTFTVCSGLFPVHMDIYEEGDLLYKPEGARFLLVRGRELKEQPCPLCGTLNTKEQHAGVGCGLLIVKE